MLSRGSPFQSSYHYQKIPTSKVNLFMTMVHCLSAQFISHIKYFVISYYNGFDRFVHISYIML